MGLTGGIFLGKQIYKLYLDDYSKPSFTSFNKAYFETLDGIDEFISALRNDKKCKSNHNDLITAGETKLTHTVAYQNKQFLTKVKCYEKCKSSFENYAWEHINTWGFPYYMKSEKIECEHIWISSGGAYFRCIKANFKNLHYRCYKESYDELGGGFWGYPHQVEYKRPNTFNRLFVIEKHFKSKNECLQDVENFNKEPIPEFSEILNDIFGDG